MGQVAGIKRDDADDDDFTESCGVDVTGGVTYLILLTLSSFLFAAHAHTVAACFAVVPMLCHLFLIFLWVYKKVVHTRLPSVGFRSWSRSLAVNLLVTWVINPAVGCHYFPPGLQLPPRRLRGLLPIMLLGEQRHDGCEQFASDCYPTASRLRFEPGPFCAWVQQHANHSATEPSWAYTYVIFNKSVQISGRNEYAGRMLPFGKSL